MYFKNANGVEYEVIFRKPDKRYYGKDCDGFCTDPNKEAPKIYINPHRTDQTQLNTIIHEVAHAFFWDKKESGERDAYKAPPEGAKEAAKIGVPI